MTEDNPVKNAKNDTTSSKDSVKLRLTLSKQTARKLVRVTRWEQESRDASLELTGRK